MNNLIIKEDSGHLRISPTQQLKINEEFRLLNARDHLLPVKMTRFFQQKIDEVTDFIDDRENMPDDAPGNIIQKYRNRMLFIPTSTCASHCQYCFHQDVLSEQHETGKKIFDKAILELDSYLSTHPDVEEVILSDGNNALEKLC
ncbi:hypothetical protein [Photorhabdus stackebrandtii]|uniref:hypothetical protein n=1 Tax=Photorhabdus stackebrandtii TaxID=1123042 RepID=UPI001A99CC64|nr:hypothetical protein [Photorhabdus stackebrandtii]